MQYSIAEYSIVQALKIPKSPNQVQQEEKEKRPLASVAQVDRAIKHGEYKAGFRVLLFEGAGDFASRGKKNFTWR